MNGRHEEKHYINASDYAQLRARLRAVAEPDSNAGEDGGYMVRSLYFDNYTDKVVLEKLSGLSKREKFRLRYYNGDTSYIRLERKSKENRLAYKEYAEVTAEQCARILACDYSCLMQGASDAPLLAEFYSKIRYQNLRPRNIVDYYREAYMFGIMLERYDKAFLDRMFSTSAGQLYSAKIAFGQRGDFDDTWKNERNAKQPIGRAGGLGAMMDAQKSQGGSLQYSGRDIEKYNMIFDNAVFSNCSDNDKQRVITAIENLNAGTDLEKYFDVDAALRYFAAHTVVVNLDSYVSVMSQNYYLYERGGRIMILPWDYNFAFGSFIISDDAEAVVNFPIDTPVEGVSMAERPLLKQDTPDSVGRKSTQYLLCLIFQA